MGIITMDGVFMASINKLTGIGITVCAICSGLASAHAAAENPGGWEYSVAPLYLWAKSIEGTAALGPSEAELDLDFQDDVLDNLDAAFAIHFEARQGDLSLFAEYNYAKLDPTIDASIGPIPIQVDVEFKETIWEAGVRYVVADTGSTQWRVFGGIRNFDQDVNVKVAGQGPLEKVLEVSGGDDWWHGFGGAGVTTKLSQNWSLVANVDMGYKSSDNQSVHALGMFDYRFRDWGSFFFGYRLLDIDYHNGKSSSQTYSFDGDQQGPLLGFAFYF